MAKKYWARRPFAYAGQELDRGQITELVGARNDEKLVRLEYFAPVERKAEIYRCGICGAEFIGLAEREHHGDKRHSGKVLTPEEEDRMAEREERLMEKLAPLNLDKAKGK
ncbi:MAG: hypothetical protein JRD89_04120 [Deltaproteobacteria bacterium]|nr:hypothetical protein [Deltaproteobacteria bacterium]